MTRDASLKTKKAVLELEHDDVHGVGPDAPGLTCLGDDIETQFVAETLLPTTEGVFRVRAYRSKGSLRESEPIAMISGDVKGKSGVPVRVHDQCFTSEVFGSLKCDCKEQLNFAKEYTKKHGGVVIYMPQEGRGIGLANKIKAYSMQEKGLDTVDANRVLGFKDDYRSYEPVQAILKDLGIKSIRLLTNNPRKIRLLSQLSIVVEGRLPVIIKGGEHSQGYLTAKAMRMAHLLPDGVKLVDASLSPLSTPSSSASQSDNEDTATDESQDEDESPLSAGAIRVPLVSPTSSSSSSSESY
ncbi:Gtp cyclohydrolase ii [Globisporangium polare]